jgi:hypothetical protein
MRTDYSEFVRLSMTTVALSLAVLTQCKAELGERSLPAAFGPYTQLVERAFEGSRSFTANDRIVGTYYFYWYDAASKKHVTYPDGADMLTTHPPTLENFSYKSKTWHKQQLSDMSAAGIDVVLPVFWGAPSEQDSSADLHWSYTGLAPLVEAREQLEHEGLSPPRIGLFYDTSTLQYNAWNSHADLTTDFGRKWFYYTIRDFFSMIPPKHWAMIDGRPIVLLYSAAFAKKHDQTVIDYTKEQFLRDFAGRTPYIAAEVSWNVRADNKVAWGGALGLKQPGIASLGPGYDHSAVRDRTPLVVNRRGGRFYEEQWLEFLKNPSNIMVIETWNEFHEGTDIAESLEHGRQYIELTRKYTDLFKRDRRVEASQSSADVSRSAPAMAIENQRKKTAFHPLPLDNEWSRWIVGNWVGTGSRMLEVVEAPCTSSWDSTVSSSFSQPSRKSQVFLRSSGDTSKRNSTQRMRKSNASLRCLTEHWRFTLSIKRLAK